MGLLDRNQALTAPDPARKDRFFIQVPFTSDPYQIVANSVTVGYSKIPAKARFNGGSNSYYPDNTISMPPPLYSTRPTIYVSPSGYRNGEVSW